MEQKSKELNVGDVTVELAEKVIQIKRVTKVVKGGKRMAFRALVIVGDQQGSVGIGLGKSKEVPSAIRKALEKAKKTMLKVNLSEGTIPHSIVGRFGTSRVIMKPAPDGTGVIAGGAVRILLESAGVRNVVAKCLGSSNLLNTALAAVDGFSNLRDLDQEIKFRGKPFTTRRYSRSNN